MNLEEWLEDDAEAAIVTRDGNSYVVVATGRDDYPFTIVYLHTQRAWRCTGGQLLGFLGTDAEVVPVEVKF